MPFNNIEKRIIRVLYQHQTALSTSKIVKYTGYSYNTVKKYLMSLNKRGYVRYTHHGNAIYWWLKEGKGDANNKKQRTFKSVPKPKMQITILEQTEKEQEGKEQ